jgi:hypothetical protein
MTIKDPSVCSPGGNRATTQSLAGRPTKHGRDLGIRTAVPQPARLGFALYQHYGTGAILTACPDKPMCSEKKDKGWC